MRIFIIIKLFTLNNKYFTVNNNYFPLIIITYLSNYLPLMVTDDDKLFLLYV